MIAPLPLTGCDRLFKNPRIINPNERSILRGKLLSDTEEEPPPPINESRSKGSSEQRRAKLCQGSMNERGGRTGPSSNNDKRIRYPSSSTLGIVSRCGLIRRGGIVKTLFVASRRIRRIEGEGGCTLR